MIGRYQLISYTVTVAPAINGQYVEPNVNNVPQTQNILMGILGG